MLSKAKNSIILLLSLGLISTVCLTGCSKQPLKIGNVALIYVPNPSQTESQVMNSLHVFGISNPVVQIWGSGEILVEIPPFKDFNQRDSFIGEGQLEDYEQILDSSGNIMTMKTGSVLVYQADLSKKDPSQTDSQVMTDIQSTIENRLHALGISNPVVQKWGTNRLFVEIPPVKDVGQVINLIGQVALLEFKEQQTDSYGNVQTDSKGNPIWIPATALGTDGVIQETLTGKHLKSNTYVGTDNLGKPVVEFEWNTEGAKLFEEITTVLYNNGVNRKPLGIFLDNAEISAPIVNGVIGAKGEIDNLTLTQSKILSIEINSGAMSAPLQIIRQTNF
jgi:preprotein translocase subunit SecD